MSESSPHARLAREAVEAFTGEGRIIGVPEWVPEEFVSERAAVFVCLKIHGRLRGCIGTVVPVQNSLAEEIIENAVSAANRDFRFLPVERSELESLDYTVDVLTEPEPIESLSQLDPKRYGVIVQSGGKRGLLLPDLEGIETAEEQVSIARHKAFISERESVQLYRFAVLRFK